MATRRKIAALTAAAAAAAGLITGCAAQATPTPTVVAFLTDWQAGKFGDAARQTDGDRSQVVSAMSAMDDQLDAVGLQLFLDKVHHSGTNGWATFKAHVTLQAEPAPWIYAGRMDLHQTGGVWRVHWAPSVLNPQLKQGQRFAIVTQTPDRQPILDDTGRSLLANQSVDAVGVYPGRVTDPEATAEALAKVTSLDPDLLAGEIKSAPPQTFMPVVTLAEQGNQGLIDRLGVIPDVTVQRENLPIQASVAQLTVGQLGPATVAGLQQVGAPYQPGDTIGLGGLEQTFQRRLAGVPGIQVVAQDPAGSSSTVLQNYPVVPSQSVTTTLDYRVEQAAEKALAGLKAPASLVAVQSATGSVLAAADHGTPSDLALNGHYQPGMAFSIISAEALLQAGVNTGDPVPCQPSTSGDPGKVPTFKDDFDTGCAAAFSALSSKLTPAQVQQAASRFGLGESWQLPLAEFSGQVPVTQANKADELTGAGGVQVSPLDMALAAGAVDAGTWRPPVLLSQPAAASAVPAVPLDAGQVSNLRDLMAGSSKTGGGTGGQVFGVGATAQGAQGQPVSWFVGFRGDIAFAVAIEGSADAGKIASQFLKAAGSV